MSLLRVLVETVRSHCLVICLQYSMTMVFAMTVEDQTVREYWQRFKIKIKQNLSKNVFLIEKRCTHLLDYISNTLQRHI